MPETTEPIRYGGRIPPEAGSEKCAGEGADYKRQAIPEAGIGYEPSVGGKILTNTVTALVHTTSGLLLSEPKNRGGLLCVG